MPIYNKKIILIFETEGAIKVTECAKRIGANKYRLKGVEGVRHFLMREM